MGRFRDMWASGKFLAYQKTEMESNQKKEAARLFEELSPELAVPEGTREIFDALKVKRGNETGRWLASLNTSEANKVTEKVSTQAASAGTSFDDIVALIDLLFKEFSDLTYEFNKTASASDYLVSYEKPATTEKKSDDHWYKPITRTYQGRLTTRQWGLVVKGTDKISIFLLPAGALLAFSIGQDSEDKHPAFMVIERASDSGAWSVGGEPIRAESIPHLAKELLGDLIRVSSGVMNESELFSTSKEHPKLGENMAVGFKQKQAQPQAPGEKPKIDADIHEACDIVDHAVDRELKLLYAQAVKVSPESTGSLVLRRQISAVEAFRVKMLDAFTQYTHDTQVEPAQIEQMLQTKQAELLS